MVDRFFSVLIFFCVFFLGVIYRSKSGLRESTIAGDLGEDISAIRAKKEGSSALLSQRAVHGFYLTIEPLVAFCVRVGLTANVLTAFSLIFGFLAALMVLANRWGLSAFFACLCALCDGLDGQVARATRTASNSGEVFDASVDRYNEFLFLAAVALYARMHFWLLLLTLVALLGSLMVSYATAKAEALQVAAPRGIMRRGERAIYLMFGSALVPFTSLLWADPLLSLSPIIVALGLVAFVANISAVQRLFAIARLVRQPPPPTSEMDRSFSKTQDIAA